MMVVMMAELRVEKMVERSVGCLVVYLVGTKAGLLVVLKVVNWVDK